LFFYGDEAIPILLDWFHLFSIVIGIAYYIVVIARYEAILQLAIYEALGLLRASQ